MNIKRNTWRVGLQLFVCLFLLSCMQLPSEQLPTVQVEPMPKKSLEIRYVSLGDSYTKGEGTTPDYSWPVVLTTHLQKEGINITLVANPAQSGWTTQEVIEIELLAFEAAKPNFATLMIGANDFVQRMPPQTFRSRIGTIMDDMLKVLPSRDALIVITLPDFSLTPTGKAYEGNVDLQAGIEEFNDIIIEEAEKRDIALVDLFESSKAVEEHPELISEDGLHPSALGYARWEQEIYPVAKAQIAKLQQG